MPPASSTILFWENKFAARKKVGKNRILILSMELNFNRSVKIFDEKL
jgi:hypothetical protein